MCTLGSGKSLIAGALMDDLPMFWATMTINLSAHTSSAVLQGMLEGGLEKRTKARTSVPYTAARTFACNLHT